MKNVVHVSSSYESDIHKMENTAVFKGHYYKLITPEGPRIIMITMGVPLEVF